MEERKLDNVEFIVRDVQAIAICSFHTKEERNSFVQFCVEGVPQFKIRLSSDGVSMIYDPSLTAQVVRFDSEQPDLEALLRQMNKHKFHNDQNCSEIWALGQTQAALLISHSICDGRCFQEIIAHFIHNKQPFRPCLPSSQLAQVDLTNFKYEHQVVPNAFTLDRQPDMQIFGDDIKYKWVSYDLSAHPQLKHRATQKICVANCLLRLRASQILGQIQPANTDVSALLNSTGISCHIDFAADMRPYLEQGKQYGNAFAHLWDEFVLKGGETADHYCQLLTSNFKRDFSEL